MSQLNSEESEDYMHQSQTKAKYSKTSMKKKEQLVDLVTSQNWSIYKASKKLKLSNSTAKSILRNFEKYGTILEKFTKNRISKLQQMERQEETTPKEAPMVKTEQNLEKIQIKEEPDSENEKQLKIWENNMNYFSFFPYSIPLYFGLQQ